MIAHRARPWHKSGLTCSKLANKSPGFEHNQMCIEIPGHENS